MKLKQHLKAFMPASVIQSRLHKNVYMQFADKIGLVYFGYVDQHGDEHRLVRGLTVSASHRDNHYCIGSFKGYDVTLVERHDTIRFPGKSSKSYDWIIMTFDLHTLQDTPHVFMGLHSHSDTFYAHLFTKFAQLQKVQLGTFGPYDQAFTKQYALYAEPAQAVMTQRLFDASLTKTIADQFGAFTVELVDGVVYLYAQHHHPTAPLLEKLLTHGIWLTESLDAKMSVLHEQSAEHQGG